MRIGSIILLFIAGICTVGCGSDQPATPVETFKTYTKAVKAKDITAMKVLLSDATMKMHQQQAKAQNVPVDDIVKRETLLNENQTTVEYKDEKIEGDKATLKVKTSYGTWETLPFVREDGVWKIDKAGYANQMIQDMDESQRKLDQMINSVPPTPLPPANY